MKSRNRHAGTEFSVLDSKGQHSVVLKKSTLLENLVTWNLSCPASERTVRTSVREQILKGLH
jgi:hypothetical protein